jgi:hypothetical protein
MRLLLAVLGLIPACGSVPSRHIDDAPGGPRDATAHDATTVPMDAPGCTTFIASTSTATDVLSYTFSGGSFQSYGCAPIDPNYWMSGAGMSATVTFVAPQSHPSIRVWGMNTDDTASVTVNGNAYPLDPAKATLSPKVVCGLSPGPDGMTFVSGQLTGANTPGEGNYSYQDLRIDQTNVTSIQISGLTGAGWGFAGASVPGCTTQT